jgi:Txe/YoeB family toxin of Txe-Axe toxin-antitoxin module
MRALEDFLSQGRIQKIHNDEEADCALIQYKKQKDRVKKYTAQRDRVIAQVNQWLAEVCVDPLAEMNRLEKLLKDYYVERLSENPSLLTINRPFGRFGLIRDLEGCAFQVDVEKGE